MPTQAAIIEESVDVLDQKKTSFESRVKSAVHSLVENSSGNDCVGLIRRYQAGSYNDAVTYKNRLPGDLSSGANPRVTQDAENNWVCEWNVRMFGSGVDVWVKCSIAMLKHGDKAGMPKYKDTQLDSCLSAPILQRVQEEWADFIKENGEVVSATMVKILASDPVIAKSLAEQIVTSIRAAGKPVSDEMRKAIVHFLTDQVTTHIASESVNQISTQVGHSIGHAALHTIAAGIGTAFIHALGMAVSKMLAHAALSSAAKAAILNVAGHIIAHSVIAASAAALLAAMGVSASGAMFAFVLLPVVIAFAACEAQRFPRQLAKKVAPEVAKAVTGTYRAGNRSLLEKIFNDVVRSNLKSLAMDIVADSKVVNDIMAAASADLEMGKLEVENGIRVEVQEIRTGS